MTSFTPTRASGSHFYKYQTSERLDRLKTVILEHLLYIPSVAQLNDPADCRPKLRLLSEEEMVSFLWNSFVRGNPTMTLDELEKRVLIIRHNIRLHGLEWAMRESAKLLNEQMEQHRVYSMSKRFNNLSLWAKYAADHTGYCLEFVNQGPLFQNTIEVFYGETAPFDLIDSKNRDSRFLVCKRADWASEEEVRVIRARGSEPLVKIEPQWLTRIILGKDMTSANENQIREWATQRQPTLLVVRAYFDELHQELRLR
jgi:hypothetical protein